MNDKEVYEAIIDLHTKLHPISQAVADGIEFSNGTCIQYLSDKFTGLLNTAKHIDGQFKHKIKERNAIYKQQERERRKQKL